MELDARKMQILQAIIDDYILTATPVGSRTIAKRSDIGFSSATIRNEMADLEDMGYLDQPHTSAGRIPSDKAYRLYVNTIMQRAKLSDAEIHYIQDHYSHRLDEVDEVVKQTAWVLSSITKYTSMVLAPQLHAIKLKYIHLVPIAEDKALAIVVTDAGMTRDSIIRIPQGMSPDALTRLGRTLSARFSNCRLDDLKAVALQGGKVVPGDRIVEHIGVHCRRHQFRTVTGKHGGREHIVRKPVRHLCNDVGGGRRYQHKVSPLCQRHMLHAVLKVAVEGVDHAAAVAQCLKGERGDELSGIFCHNDLHVTVHLCQTAGDICHFIGSDGTGDSQHHCLSL